MISIFDHNRLKRFSFLDFLDPVDSTIIGFGGPFVILFFVYLLNKAIVHYYLDFFSILLILVLVYILSLATGPVLDSIYGIGDRMSAIISGFFAPLTYGFLLHLGIRYYGNKNNSKDNNILDA